MVVRHHDTSSRTSHNFNCVKFRFSWSHIVQKLSCIAKPMGNPDIQRKTIKIYYCWTDTFHASEFGKINSFPVFRYKVRKQYGRLPHKPLVVPKILHPAPVRFSQWLSKLIIMKVFYIDICLLDKWSEFPLLKLKNHIGFPSTENSSSDIHSFLARHGIIETTTISLRLPDLVSKYVLAIDPNIAVVDLGRWWYILKMGKSFFKEINPSLGSRMLVLVSLQSLSPLRCLLSLSRSSVTLFHNGEIGSNPYQKHNQSLKL